MREAKAITSRRQKLRNQDKEGYAASLEKERKRKYLLKNRNRGLGDPPASVGVDSPNPNGGVAGEPPASVGEVTQPPTGAPAVDLSTAQPNPPTAAAQPSNTTRAGLRSPEEVSNTKPTVAEGGEGSAEGTTRRLVWVDVDPDALEYLRSVDFLLRTVSGAVRLREAPRNKRPPKRS